MTRHAFVLALAAIVPAFAAPVSVANPSFETATLSLVGNGVFSQLVPGSTIFVAGGTLGSWNALFTTVNSAAGGFSPSPGGVNWTTPWWSGDNIGYLQISSRTIALSQILTTTLANDTDYTLTVDVGRRLFTPIFGYALQLYAGGSLLASAGNLSLASNTSGTDTLLYSSGSANPLAGQALEIRLSATGTASVTEAFSSTTSASMRPR